MPRRIIGVDWGTSAFRAYRLDESGAICESLKSELGILGVRGGDFEGAFESQIGDWLAADAEAVVIACGMLGSRQGWHEVPYLNCPAGLGDLAAGLRPLRLRSGRTLWLVPGLVYRDERGVPDVLRGEETLIAGSVGGDDRGHRIFVLPGTHSKWAVVSDGRIVRFSTFMTGELFSLLCRHSILARLMADGPDDSRAFRRGLAQARQDDRALLANLFSVRTLGLFGDVAQVELRPYLSGLLIGAEVGAALRTVDPAHGIIVIGDTDQVPRYDTALRFFGVEPRRERADLALARGLARIAAQGIGGGGEP